MSIEAMYVEIEQARGALHDFHAIFSSGQYDLNEPRTSLEGQSVARFYRRANVIFESLLGLRPSDEESAQALFVLAKVPEIRASTKAFFDHAQSSLSTLQSNWREGMTLRDQNGNFMLQLTLPDGSVVTNLDLSGNVRQMEVGIGQLAVHLAQLLPLSKAESIGDLSARAAAVGDLVRQMDALRSQARQLVEATGASAESTAEHDRAAQACHAQAEAATSKVQVLQQQATTDVGSVTALVEKIKTVGASADALEQQIAGYTAGFDAFQKQLDGRNQEFVLFQADNQTVRSENSKRSDEIDRLTTLADSMILGATTAGLAKSMEDARARYEERMNSARIGFYVAVVVLIASALPLAAHLLPGLVGSWIPGFDAKAEGSPYAVLGKIVLLLPATWLTAFFTKSYADFFHLEREYAHKAALAMSVDGFKRQAEKYQEEITAEVFMEIRNNPAKGNPATPASHPLYDVLAKVAGKVVDKRDAAKP